MVRHRSIIYSGTGVWRKGVMERELVWKTIEAERLALADLLDGLTARQWDEPSLCAGWKIRDVAAHVTLSTRARPLNAMAGLVRARGSFNRYVATDARARSARPSTELVGDLRRVAAVRHHPPGTKPEDPLVDVLVHSQDIAVPLRIAHPMPTEAAVAAADRVWSMSFPFHARRRAAGIGLRALDAPWERGSGDEVAGPIAAILLLLCGRSVGLDQLAGPGTATLADRMQ